MLLAARPQLKHNQGRMLTRGGKSIDSLGALIAHYGRETDGIPVLLTVASRAYDPPPPVTPQRAQPQPSVTLRASLSGTSHAHAGATAGSPPDAQEPAYQNLDQVNAVPGDSGGAGEGFGAHVATAVAGPAYQNLDQIDEQLRQVALSAAKVAEPSQSVYEVPDDLHAGRRAAVVTDPALDGFEVSPDRIQIMKEVCWCDVPAPARLLPPFAPRAVYEATSRLSAGKQTATHVNAWVRRLV